MSYDNWKLQSPDDEEPWEEGDDDAADDADRKYDEMKDEGKL